MSDLISQKEKIKWTKNGKRYQASKVITKQVIWGKNGGGQWMK